MDENIVTVFYDRLADAKNPASFLVGLYAQIFSLPFDAKLIPQVAKLVKLFGRKNVFLSIVDLAFVKQFNPKENCYPLLSYICKRRLSEYVDDAYNDRNPVVDVDKVFEKIDKQLRRKLRFRSPFDE